MLVKTLLFLFLFSFTIFVFSDKGGAMAERQDYVSQVKEKFKNINLSDGVSKEEAVIIAQNDMIDDGGADKVYLTKPKVSESGLLEDCWYVGFDVRSKVRFRNGLQWYSIHIDKKTGEIKSRGWGPS